MKAKSEKLKTRLSYDSLVTAISQVHRQAQAGAAGAVNRWLLVRNWLIGGYIVEFEQEGKDRAKYGTSLLPGLARDLAGRGVDGLGVSILERCRRFYSVTPQLRAWISATVSTESGHLLPHGAIHISDTVSTKLPIGARQTLRDMPTILSPEAVLNLSWSHWQELVRLDDPWKRAFYENESLKGNWSVRQLQRQIASLLYERTGLSTDKKAVIERARKQAGQAPVAIGDLIRDPYILEFVGLAEKPRYTENELEGALLDHIQNFLLELGAGFCFEARQKRITLGNEHDYLDLVFYHRLLRCHLLIDLKVRKFRHADAGQMNFYLNYWKANLMAEGDNPPVGLLLCSDKDETKVEYATGGLSHRLFVSRYLVALPKPDALRKLVESDRAVWDQRRSAAKE